MNSRKVFLYDSLHLFALCGFAIAQPLLDLLSRNPVLFIAHRTDPLTLSAFVLVLCVGPAAVCISIEALLAAFGQSARRVVHLALVTSLVALSALPVTKLCSPTWRVDIGLAVALGAAATALYRRIAPVRTFFTLLAPAPVIFAAVFVLTPAVTRLLRPPSAAAVGTTRIAAPAPIVMVVFDELPLASLLDARRRIDPVRYPNFAAIAATGTWYRNATTVAGRTHLAVPAILTADYPKPDALPSADDYPQNLFTLLASTYSLDVVEPMTRLCAAALCPEDPASVSSDPRFFRLLVDSAAVYSHIVLPNDLEQYLPPINDGWSDFLWFPPAASTQVRVGRVFRWLGIAASAALDRDRIARFRKFVTTIHNTQRPVLYFIHSMLPHAPWVYSASCARYPGDDGLRAAEGGEHWRSNETQVEQSYQRHLVQLGCVDHLLGNLLTRLRAVGLFDRSLIVVTADHGVSFHANEPRRVTTLATAGDTLPVPLIVKAPHQTEGRIDDRNVETIDILPIIGETLGFTIPWRRGDPPDGELGFPRSRSKRVFVQALKGDRLIFDGTFAQQTAALERKLDLFGSGTLTDVFSLGPHRMLLGKPVDALPVGEDGAGLTTVIDQRELLANVHTGGPVLPVLISGHVQGTSGATGPLELAIAVNGIVQAITLASTDTEDEGGFSTMVPESSYHDGANDVQVYVVSTGAAGPKLTHAATRDVRVVRAADGEAIVNERGKVIPVMPNVLTGYANVVVDQGWASVRGWAVDTRKLEPAQQIVIFANGKMFGQGVPLYPRPDIVRFYNSPRGERSGFRITALLPTNDVQETQRTAYAHGVVRAFALAEDVASELHYEPRW